MVELRLSVNEIETKDAVVVSDSVVEEMKTLGRRLMLNPVQTPRSRIEGEDLTPFPSDEFEIKGNVSSDPAGIHDAIRTEIPESHAVAPVFVSRQRKLDIWVA